ncbi:MAG: VanZ family protein [Bacteroidia bacterium]|nr:VanZ family protein [Bacteroidia bacterium]
MTLLLCKAFYNAKTLNNFRWIIVIGLIISVLYGGVIELIQEHIVSWRSGDRYDFIADVLGAVLGSLIFIYFYASPNKTRRNGLKEKS